jgi:hypothetical protein
MTPVALATVAMLASTPVGAQNLKLPNEMLGTWCTTQDPLVEEKDGTITIKYERRQDFASALSLHRRRELYHKRTMAIDRLAACLEQQGTAMTKKAVR